MKLKLTWLLTLFMAFVMQFSFAQEKTVTGTVTTAMDGLPLPGASVIVKGTSRGQQTDFDGKFTIQVNQGDVLVISYVGMTPGEVVIGAGNTYDVALEDANALDEVVIVGYGTSTKKAFTGTATTIEAENLEAKSFSNVSQALAGEVAGVSVINTSGQPGSVSTVRIRGFGSVNGNRDPLYVVDGVPYTGTANINAINPSDIKTTTVLKDATATAIYGSRGANGVILITTKTGASDTSSVEVDFKTGFNVSLLPRMDVIKSADQYIGLSWESLYNAAVVSGEANPEAWANANLFSGSGISPNYNMWNVADGSELIDPVTRTVRPGVTRKYNPEDWEDYGFQASYRTEANVRLSGGNEDTKYFTSFGFLDDEGYIINSDYKRYTTRLNVTHKVKDWLSGSANIGYALSETNNNGQTSDSGSIFWFVDNIPSIYPLFLRDTDGNIVGDPVFGGNQYDYGEQGRGFGALTNSIADAYFDRSTAKRHEINGNFSLDAKLHENVSFEMRYGAQYYNNKYHSLNNPYYGSSAGTQGSLYKNDTQIFSQTFLQLLRYNNTFGDHTLEVLAAHESSDWERNYFSASKSNGVLPYLAELENFVVVSSPPQSYSDRATLESYFSQVNYNFKDKYFLSGSLRRDGSSRFVTDKWGTFWSLGASWVMSGESFMDNLEVVDYLKLKASYGLTGEQAGVGLYPGYNTYSVDPSGDPSNPISIPIASSGTPELTWETSKMFQTGVEFSLSNYLDVAVDYYIKNTDDLLFDRRVGPSAGIALQTVNDGQLRNSGLEFDINAHVLNKGEFKLDIGFNGEMLNNEITTMPIEPATGLNKWIDTSISPYGMAEGRSIFDFYMREWAGVDPADGSAMWYQYYDDVNDNGVLDGNESAVLTDASLDPAGLPNASASYHEYVNTHSDTNIKRTTTKNYSEATEVFVGKSAIPKLRGAFRLSAKYKGFDLTTQFTYSIGGYSYDGLYANLMGNDVVGGNNWHQDITDRWQQPGDITDVPKLSNGVSGTTQYNSLSTRFLIKSDYLGLNNVRLGYTIPSNFVKDMGLQQVNIFVSGDNLFMLTNRDGFNPSTSEAGGSSQYRYSPLSTFTFGARIKF